jgi:hypothetical protein
MRSVKQMVTNFSPSDMVLKTLLEFQVVRKRQEDHSRRS